MNAKLYLRFAVILVAIVMQFTTAACPVNGLAHGGLDQIFRKPERFFAREEIYSWETQWSSRAAREMTSAICHGSKPGDTVLQVGSHADAAPLEGDVR